MEKWNNEWLKDHHDFVHQEISRWIQQEHTLIANRMGWLLSANAFLFAPVAILLSNDHNLEGKRVLLQAVTGLGMFFAVFLTVPIVLAMYTLWVLRKRYQYSPFKN